jgi:hypothetical protein
MRLRTRVAGLAAVLVAGLLVVGGATASAGTVAVAEAPPPPAYLWLPAECSTGQITGAAYDAEGFIELTGTAVMCAGLPVSTFTVVPFWSDTTFGAAVGNQFVRYAPIGEVTGFRAVLTTNAVHSEGICLVASTVRRMDCVTVAEGPDGTLVLSPAPDSPGWTERVYVTRTSGCEAQPDGICGSCVGVTRVGPGG